MFTETRFTTAKMQKPPNCSSTNKWINNTMEYCIIYLFIIIYYYNAIKKNKILPFTASAATMGGP